MKHGAILSSQRRLGATGLIGVLGFSGRGARVSKESFTEPLNQPKRFSFNRSARTCCKAVPGLLDKPSLGAAAEDS